MTSNFLKKIDPVDLACIITTLICVLAIAGMIAVDQVNRSNMEECKKMACSSVNPQHDEKPIDPATPVPDSSGNDFRPPPEPETVTGIPAREIISPEKGEMVSPSTS